LGRAAGLGSVCGCALREAAAPLDARWVLSRGLAAGPGTSVAATFAALFGRRSL